MNNDEKRLDVEVADKAAPAPTTKKEPTKVEATNANINLTDFAKVLAAAMAENNKPVLEILKAGQEEKDELRNSLKINAERAAMRATGFAGEDRYEVRVPTSLRSVLGEYLWVAVNGVAVNIPVDNTPVILPESLAMALMEKLAKIDRFQQGKSNLNPFKELVEENAKVGDK